MMFIGHSGLGRALGDASSSSGVPAMFNPVGGIQARAPVALPDLTAPPAPAGWSTGTKVAVGAGVVVGSYLLFKLALRMATFGIL